MCVAIFTKICVQKIFFEKRKNAQKIALDFGQKFALEKFTKNSFVGKRTKTCVGTKNCTQCNINIIFPFSELN